MGSSPCCAGVKVLVVDQILTVNMIPKVRSRENLDLYCFQTTASPIPEKDYANSQI